MSTIVLLDAGPLGMIANPRAVGEPEECARWAWSLADAGYVIVVPEIADYEVRRELLRAGKRRSVEALDGLAEELAYLPITTEVMRRAAELWATARARGKPTASSAALDCDVILAAQASLAGAEDDEVIIATTNVGHLSLFADTREWQDIG